MKIIVAGSRTVTKYIHIPRALQLSGFLPATEIVSGCAKGVDTLGEVWAKAHKITVTQFPAKWGKYGKFAGYQRNLAMSEYADALVAIWDGKSNGTRHMIKVMGEIGKPVYVHRVDKSID